MIVVLSDTHRQTDPELTEQLESAVREAELLCHAGDFTSTAVLDEFQSMVSRCHAVHGNADTPAVQKRLPAERTIEHDGIRIAMTHHRPGGLTGLQMFGRAARANIVISGHTHQPSITVSEDITLLNPGSHADPRGNRPGYGTISRTTAGVTVCLKEPDGTIINRQEVKSIK